MAICVFAFVSCSKEHSDFNDLQLDAKTISQESQAILDFNIGLYQHEQKELEQKWEMAEKATTIEEYATIMEMEVEVVENYLLVIHNSDYLNEQNRSLYIENISTDLKELEAHQKKGIFRGLVKFFGGGCAAKVTASFVDTAIAGTLCLNATAAGTAGTIATAGGAFLPAGAVITLSCGGALAEATNLFHTALTCH